jgi:hypothetical protein
LGAFGRHFVAECGAKASGVSEAECRPSRSTPGGYARFGADMALCAGERGWIVENSVFKFESFKAHGWWLRAFGSHFVAEWVAKAAALARQSVVEAGTLSGDAKFSARIGTLCQWVRLVIQGLRQSLCGRVRCQSSGGSEAECC